ncbi:type II toxin-antitoxin system death-on-curing family toxin [Daeguia caeni]|uniref:Type II toxin-antitoxin system death-on-curing family toxin n=1 Tax=Daeguia caeni TaxID=439612 RepID=A0ABV9H592_9HYPH
MQNEPLWLPIEEVIKINREEVSESGENFALLRRDLLESALARPVNHYHYSSDNDILRLAVILMLSIAQNHPFEQGNKRTGWTAGMIFMALNGYEFNWDHEAVAVEFMKLIQGQITVDRFEEQIYYFIKER